MNLVNFVNFVADLAREPLIFSLLLCSHQKLIEGKGNGGFGRVRALPELTPEEVHNVHEVHAWDLGEGRSGWEKLGVRTAEITKSLAHPKRDAHPLKRIPRELQMQQPVTTQNTQGRIPSLCSTTGVCCRNAVAATGAGAAIRRIVPTSAVLCRPPAKMPYRAVIRRLSPTMADLKVFCPEFPLPFP